MSNKTPHKYFDTLIKSSLENTERAKEFLKSHLPEKIVKYIDFNKEISLVNKEFIKDDHKTLRCDVLFQCSVKNQSGYIYGFVEGQSTADKFLPIRILMYNLEVIKWHWHNVKKEIPPIFNFILYNGTLSPYPYSINFLDILKENKISEELFFKGNFLIDLNEEDDNIIERDKKGALFKLLLKHSRDSDFYNYLIKMKKSGKFIILLEGYDIQSILTFIGEMLKRIDESEDRILDLFLGISDKIDKEVMTFTESLKQRGYNIGIQEGIQRGINQGIQQGISQGIQQGMQEGMSQGIQQGINQGIDQGITIGIDKEKHNIAKKLFENGIQLHLVKQSTGLNDEELEDIKKSIYKSIEK